MKISTPSRLHFGIIDMRGDIGRMHGSAGVAIQSPRLVLEIEKSSETIVTGARPDRAEEVIAQLLKENGISEGVRLKIGEDIPEHMGFGSGTQLSLALGTAINDLFDLGISFEEIVIGLGRSRRSGIGTHAFLKGGFIVDGGHAVDEPDTIPPLIHRSDFPEDWHFVVCVPDIALGFSGEKETNAFKKLEPPPVEMISNVSRIVLMQMIPSVLEKKIELFGDAMTKLDSIFGDYWATMQGGTYSHPVIGDCVGHLLSNGAFGAGQSSWGPALYGLAESESHGKELAEGMEDFMRSNSHKGIIYTTRADNQGAVIN